MQITIYRKPRPKSKYGKLRPAIIEIGDGVHRPKFYRYSARRDAMVSSAARSIGMREIRKTKASSLFVM